MKLLSLKLLNFRRFKEQEINFRDDFSLIFGKNGSGKSSILDAIGYCLFGPSGKDFIRVNVSLLKSHFLTDREPSKIELIFQYGFDTYRIVRIIDSGIKKFSNDFIIETKDSLFGINGLEIIGGTEVTNYIVSLIGVSRDVFLRSVFAKQKDLEVLSGTKEERKKLINSILGLDKIEYLINDFKRIQKEKKITLDYLKSKITQIDLDELNKQKKQKQEELKIINTDLKNIQKEYNDLQKSFLNVKKDFDFLSLKKSKHNILNQNIMLKKEQIINVQKNITEKTNLLDQIKTHENYIKENEFIIKKELEIKSKLIEIEQIKQKFIQKQSLEIEQKNLIKTKQDLILKLKSFLDLNLEINKINSQIEKIQLDLKKSFEEKSFLESSIIEIKSQGEQLKTELELIEKLGIDGDCPTCKRPLLDYLPNLLILFNKELKSKREKYKVKNEELNIKKTMYTNIEHSLNLLLLEQKNILLKEKEIIIYKQNLENLENNLTQINDKISSFKDIFYSQESHDILKIEYQNINIEFLKYQKILGQVSQKQTIIDFLNTNTNLLTSYENELENFGKELITLDFKVEDYDLNKKLYDEINQKINSKNSQLNSISKQNLQLDFEIKNIEKNIFDFLEDKKQIDILIFDIDIFEIKKQILQDYIIYLLNYLKPNIEDLASQYFSIITDNKYFQISLDDEYNIEVDGKTIDLYSGGERDLANLCLRLSLGQNLSNNNGKSINFLILDEILASQDKDRQQNILINLKKLENKFSQIILISHLEEIKELATNLIEVKFKNIDESEAIIY